MACLLRGFFYTGADRPGRDMYMRKDNWFLSRLRGLWKEHKSLHKAAYIMAAVPAVFSLAEYYAAASNPVMIHVKAETLEKAAAREAETETQASVQADENIAMFSILGAYPSGQAGYLNQNQTNETQDEIVLLALNPDQTRTADQETVQTLEDKKERGVVVKGAAVAQEERMQPEAAEKATADGEKEEESAAAAARQSVFSVTQEEVEILQRIVEAEATGQDVKGKILVANVVLNRVMSDGFPDTIKEVVFQRTGDCYQFSPIQDKRYWSVEITEGTVEAVERALAGEDYSEGALFFAARKRADKENMSWFDNNLTYLFQYGGHEFFK